MEELAGWILVAETADLPVPSLLAREGRLLLLETLPVEDRLRHLELFAVRGESAWSETRAALDLAAGRGRTDLVQALRPLLVRQAARRGWDDVVGAMGGLRLLSHDLAEAVAEERAMRRGFLEKTQIMLGAGDVEGVHAMAHARLERLPGDLDASLRLAHVEERLGRRIDAAQAWLSVARGAMERGWFHRARGALARARTLGARGQEIELMRRLVSPRRSSSGSRDRIGGRTSPRPSFGRSRSPLVASPSPCG